MTRRYQAATPTTPANAAIPDRPPGAAVLVAALLGVIAVLLFRTSNRRDANELRKPMPALSCLLDVPVVPAGCAGAFETGATMANFTAPAAARHAVLSGAGWELRLTAYSTHRL
jgi:hypothetical protein